MASAVNTDSGETPTVNSTDDWFSRTKYTCSDVTATAEGMVAGVFCGSTHRAVKLVTCPWRSSSPRVAVRRAVLSPRRSLQCDSGLRLTALPREDGRTHGWLMLPNSRSRVSLTGSTAPRPRRLRVPSPGAGCWSKRWGSRDGLGGTASGRASRSPAAQPLRRRVGVSYPFSHSLQAWDIAFRDTKPERPEWC